MQRTRVVARAGAVALRRLQSSAALPQQSRTCGSIRSLHSAPTVRAPPPSADASQSRSRIPQDGLTLDDFVSGSSSAATTEAAAAERASMTLAEITRAKSFEEQDIPDNITNKVGMQEGSSRQREGDACSVHAC